MNQLSDSDYRRLCWASRRGMLELDLMMGPFVESQFRLLPAADQHAYRLLLECEDNQLFAWLLKKELPEDPVLAGIVEKVIEYARTRQY